MGTDQLSVVWTFFVRTRGLESIEGIVLLLLVCACQAQTTAGTNAALCTHALPLAATSSRDGLGASMLREGLGESHLSLRTHHPDARCGFDRRLNLLPNFCPIEAYCGLKAPPEESRGRLHLRRGDPPEARKAFLLALAKRPKSLFIKEMMNTIN